MTVIYRENAPDSFLEMKFERQVTRGPEGSFLSPAFICYVRIEDELI